MAGGNAEEEVRIEISTTVRRDAIQEAADAEDISWGQALTRLRILLRGELDRAVGEALDVMIRYGRECAEPVQREES